MEKIADIPAFSRYADPCISPRSLADLMYTARMKVYPDGSADLLCSDRPIFREAGYEDVEFSEPETRSPAPAKDPDGSLARSKRRARSMVADYVRANDLDLFCTFTLAPDKVDRYDVQAVLKRLTYWLDNMVRRKGLKYVLVPEYHKDGAVHFHACVNRALSLVDSGTIDKHDGGKPRRPRTQAQRAEWLTAGGSVVYNVENWTLGFSTAIQMYGDRAKAINYVTKYISKSDGKIAGRWYYSGGKLQLPAVYLCHVDFDRMDTRHAWTLETLGCSCAVMHIAPGEIAASMAALGGGEECGKDVENGG